MAVQNVRSMPPRRAGHFAGECRVKARAPSECGYRDATLFQQASPRALIVEAAHRHWNLGMQAVDEFDHQALGAAGVETQNDLKNPGRSHLIVSPPESAVSSARPLRPGSSG